MKIALALLAIVACAWAQPGPPTVTCDMGSGTMPSKEMAVPRAEGSQQSWNCRLSNSQEPSVVGGASRRLLQGPPPPSGPQCEADGSSASEDLDWRVTYDNTTGKFRGHVITNLCNSHEVTAHPVYADCMKFTFPDPAFANGPGPAPLLGQVGISHEGTSVYGPLEAGFQESFVCEGSCCAPGVDLQACAEHLKHTCEGSIHYDLLPDDCGGHAQPYHYHRDMVCDYNTNSSGHSSLVGVMLDGYALYGRYEDTGKIPDDLDTCNGHYGPVPVNTEFGVTMTNVYHYHTSTDFPFTIGCYGPEKSYDKCVDFHQDIGACYDTYNITTDNGDIEYTTWCACRPDKGSDLEKMYNRASSAEDKLRNEMIKAGYNV